MNINESKCIIILDETMPSGTMANTAAILGISLGKAVPEIVGGTATDASANQHQGLIQFPIPVLQTSAEKLKELRLKLYTDDFSDISTVDFSNVSQECMTYDDFLKTTAETKTNDMKYYGLALVGPKKKINKLSGSLPLLR